MSIGRFAMFAGIAITAIAIANHAPALTQEAAPPPAADSGVIRVKSAYDMDETVARIKKDIVAKGVRFFDEIDQAQLAASAGNQVACFSAVGVRQPSAWHSVSYGQSLCWS